MFSELITCYGNEMHEYTQIRPSHSCLKAISSSRLKVNLDCYIERLLLTTPVVLSGICAAFLALESIF